MIELLYAVIIILPISLIFYFIFPTFQYLKLYFYPFHLFLWILLISLNPYKKHYLWDKPNFNPIQELPYPPINGIKIIYDAYSHVSDVKVTYSNKEYSLIETQEYSKKCINNYYIPESETCPITDIIVDYSNSNSSTYADYEAIEISNGYIYYKRNYDQGKFYDSVIIDNAYSNDYILFDNNFKTVKFSYSFHYQNIETIKRLEDIKNLEPFKKFNNYKNISDLICLFIMIFSISYYFTGNKRDDIWNYFKIIEISLQFILFGLYLVRFILFGKVKKFFKENKDLFTNEHLEFNSEVYFIDYFPKNISINSFPLALSIVFIFFFFLSLIIKDKCSCFSVRSNHDTYACEQEPRILILTFPLYIIYFICFILDIVNDAKIKKIYRNTIYNWDTSPISSIEINPGKDYELGHIFTKDKEFRFHSWKNNYFKIKRISDYNYMNIYNNSETKLCGTDNSGNLLYFPNNVECPINDIFIENNINNSIDYPDYKKLSLGYNNYLFYTNKKVHNKIIIDIKVGFSNVSLELNPEKSNELCNSIYDKGFYEKLGGKCLNYYKFNKKLFYDVIDHWDLYDFLRKDFELNNINYIGEINLYALTYQGFNSSSDGKDIGDTIRKYKSKMKDLISLSVAKSIFTSFNIIYYLFFIFVLFKDYCIEKKISLIISFVFIGLLFLHFIIIIICLSFNVIYVQNIMNRINNDFARKGINYYWILFIFCLDIFFLIYYISITLVRFKSEIKDICSKCCLCLCCKRNSNINPNNNPPNNPNNNPPNNPNNINADVTNAEGGNVNISNSEDLCVICMSERRCIAFGCGHLCYCSNCYNEIKDKSRNCPLCRKRIENMLKIYNI